jgi:hypothetical protein
VRNNLNDVSEMAKQINAALFHVALTQARIQPKTLTVAHSETVHN